MNTPPPLGSYISRTDADHLKLLSIFHFVTAGLSILGMLFLGAHYMLMHKVLMDPEIWKNQPVQQHPPAELFNLFNWFYIVVAGWMLVLLALNVFSGICLRRRTLRGFSLLVAGINCLHVPLGTVLGVFTIVVLVRDSVRESYR